MLVVAYPRLHAFSGLLEQPLGALGRARVGLAHKDLARLAVRHGGALPREQTLWLRTGQERGKEKKE